MLPSGESVSVVMPAFNEEAGVGRVVRDFIQKDYVDEVVVVDNNSTDATPEAAREQGARVVSESRQGYGCACIRALHEAATDIVVLVESDGTFQAKDLDRLIDHLRVADVVSGSRIHRRCNEPGADMAWYKILGNLVLGLLVTVIYGNRYRLDDVGSSYVIMKKHAVDKIKGRLSVADGSFSAELYLALVGSGAAVRQIPISYAPRIGQSKLSRNHMQSLKIGLKHFWHIFRMAGKYRRAHPPSLYYRSPFVFHAMNRMRWRSCLENPYRKVADLIPENASVLDVCCADGVLYYDFLHEKNVEYIGLDINRSFINAGNKRGVDIRYLDVDTAMHLPPADYVVMQDSLYQFIPYHERIMDMLLKAAGAQLIITEPVKNLAGSPNPLVKWVGIALTDPGTGLKRHRFNKHTLDALMAQYEVLERRDICGGRNMLFVINPGGG